MGLMKDASGCELGHPSHRGKNGLGFQVATGFPAVTVGGESNACADKKLCAGNGDLIRTISCSRTMTCALWCRIDGLE